jgi:hypothetical protein
MFTSMSMSEITEVNSTPTNMSLLHEEQQLLVVCEMACDNIVQ